MLSRQPILQLSGNEAKSVVSNLGFGIHVWCKIFSNVCRGLPMLGQGEGGTSISDCTRCAIVQSIIFQLKFQNRVTNLQ